MVIFHVKQKVKRKSKGERQFFFPEDQDDMQETKPKLLKIRFLKSRSAFRVAGMGYSGDKTGDKTAISGKIISL